MSVATQTAPGEILASSQRCEPGSVNIPVGKWPATADDTSVDANGIATKVVNEFNQALEKKDYKAVANLFVEDGYWRDHLALSWDLRTLKGREKIASFLNEGCRLTKIEIDTTSDLRAPQVAPLDGTGDVKGIQFFVNFTTEIGAGQGVARLAERDGQWKVWTLFTSLRELAGHEEPTNHRRTKGVEHGGKPDRKNWLERRKADADFEDSDPAVLIIGMVFATKPLCHC